MPDAEGLAAQHMAVQRIRAALTTLSPNDVRIIIEVYYLGRSAADAAVVLGIPERTVVSRTYHALRALRDACGLSSAACELRGMEANPDERAQSLPT
jgi:DNA-directed RNA polymerase specialized sigma24 family protein